MTRGGRRVAWRWRVCLRMWLCKCYQVLLAADADDFTTRHSQPRPSSHSHARAAPLQCELRQRRLTCHMSRCRHYNEDSPPSLVLVTSRHCPHWQMSCWLAHSAKTNTSPVSASDPPGPSQRQPMPVCTALPAQAWLLPLNELLHCWALGAAWFRFSGLGCSNNMYLACKIWLLILR